ncbi:MAG: Crp/Fnr family transcriptional regulator [Dehalococcoidia bacterium]|nr:Crp/Fnr family transcriptional regulator [Dehalococcoidia bacterium]
MVSLEETGEAPASAVETAEQLKRVPLLARLASEDVRALAGRGRLRRFKSGETIVREGEPGDALYVILEGAARVVMSSPTGEEATVAHLGPGECIGEFAVLDGLPRSATAIATLNVSSVYVTREQFRIWLTERPEASFALLEELSLRLRRANQGLADQLFLGLAQRLARRLVTLATTQGTPATNGGLRIRITQAELASMLGVTRESVNKELQGFASRGWLSTSRGAVTVYDLQALNLYR